MLAYTLERLLTHQAVIQRNQTGYDAYGAVNGPPNWQTHLTLLARVWWDRSSGVRSANRTFVDPAREVPIDVGGLLLPLGTDVTEQDRVSAINLANGTPYIQGIFLITAVLSQEDHMELNLTRAHLGA